MDWFDTQMVQEAKRRMRYSLELFSPQIRKQMIEDLYLEGIINNDAMVIQVFKELKEEYE